MRCLKCGTSAEDGGVYCPQCLEQMERSPVDRETPVLILPRPEPTARRNRERKPEELLQEARQQKKRLKRALFLVSLLCLLLVGQIVYMMFFKEYKRPTGQDYTTVVTEPQGTQSTNPGPVQLP